MNTLQSLSTVAAPDTAHGSVLFSGGIIVLVVAGVLGAIIWGLLRLRTFAPALGEGVSSARAARFAAEILGDGEGVPGYLDGPLSEPAEHAGSRGAAGPLAIALAPPLDHFYATTVTPNPSHGAATNTVTLEIGDPASQPSVPAVTFDDLVKGLVRSIRDLAAVVEQAALIGGGSELDRAVRTVEAFTAGLAVLPVKEVFSTAGRDVVETAAATTVVGSMNGNIST